MVFWCNCKHIILRKESTMNDKAKPHPGDPEGRTAGELTKFYSAFFKVAFDDETCSFQKDIFERNENFIDLAARQNKFERYGDMKGSVSFQLKDRTKDWGGHEWADSEWPTVAAALRRVKNFG